jgi:hypothetical protein
LCPCTISGNIPSATIYTSGSVPVVRHPEPLQPAFTGQCRLTGCGGVQELFTRYF